MQSCIEKTLTFFFVWLFLFPLWCLVWVYNEIWLGKILKEPHN